MTVNLNNPDSHLFSQWEIQMCGVTKTFGKLVANDNIDLFVRKGEIHGLLGENGAGKTVLMSILAGVYRPDKGEIYINGKRVFIDSPLTALKLGIGMVHQHFMLIPTLSVRENIILGNEPALLGILNSKQIDATLQQLQQTYNMYVELDKLVGDLPVGLQQRVEILKTLYRNVKYLILDEPTSVLADEEVKNLFDIMRKFKEKGLTLIFITHKLNEALRICDRITVLKRGKVIGTVEACNATAEMLAEMMIGKNHNRSSVPTFPIEGKPMLIVRDLTVYNEKGLKAVKNVCLEVKSGEILGLAGVEGNGQKELIEAIIGMRSPQGGEIILDGVNVKDKPIWTRREMGLAYIPDDRHKVLLPEFSIIENIILGRHNKRPFQQHLFINRKAAEYVADRLSKEFKIKISTIFDRVGSLSGGNQQKVVLAQEFSRTPKVIIAANPTRGLDVEATDYVHNKLLEMRNGGSAILLVSADLDEILKICDRIAVIYDGRIMATKDRFSIDNKEVGILMGGGVV